MFGMGTAGWLLLAGSAWLVVRLLIFVHRIIRASVPRIPAERPRFVMDVAMLTGAAMAALAFAGVVALWPEAGRGWRLVFPLLATAPAFLAGVMADFYLQLWERLAGTWLLAWRLPHYLEQLHTPDPAQRAAAAQVLAQMGPHARRAAPELIEALKDASPEVRAWAGLALWWSRADDPHLAAALRPLLEDADLRVRVAGAVNLLRLEAIEADVLLPALCDGLMHPEQVWANQAAMALSRLGPRAAAAIPILRAALWDRQPPNDAALDALATVGPDGVPVLAEALTHSDPILRSSAAYFLGSMGPGAQSAVPALQAALTNVSESFRRDIERALRRIGSP